MIPITRSAVFTSAGLAMLGSSLAAEGKTAVRDNLNEA
jgi:hypothetical protein